LATLELLHDAGVESPWALRELPPFPPVATKLMQLLAGSDTEIKKLIELLRTDMAFSSEILRRANSPLYGLTSQVNSLRHAVVLLGFDQVRALSMAVSMGAYLQPALKLHSLRQCWRHSLATALIAEQLAKASYFELDRAYTAGLLHDVGLLGLMVDYPREYANLISVTNENSFDLRYCEQELFDVDHCKAGGWLARHWKFPPEIEEVTEHHHDEPAGENLTLVSLVHFSCLLASMIGFAIVQTPQPVEYEAVLDRLPDNVKKRLPADGPALRELIASQVNILE